MASLTTSLDSIDIEEASFELAIDTLASVALDVSVELDTSTELVDSVELVDEVELSVSESDSVVDVVDSVVVTVVSVEVVVDSVVDSVVVSVSLSVVVTAVLEEELDVLCINLPSYALYGSWINVDIAIYEEISNASTKTRDFILGI